MQFRIVLFCLLWALMPLVVNAQQDEPDPYAFVIPEEEPRAQNMDALKRSIGYPSFAKENYVEGKVIVRVLVDKKGKYKKHIVLRDPHPLLTNAVVDKLPQLEFSKGIVAGKPSLIWVTIPFNFALYGTEFQEMQHVNGMRSIEMVNLKKVGSMLLVEEGLKAWPDELWKCKDIQIIQARGNQLKEIPEDFKALKELRSLILEDNQFQDVPDWLFKNKNLSLVYVGGNPIPEARLAELKEKFGDRIITEKVY